MCRLSLFLTARSDTDRAFRIQTFAVGTERVRTQIQLVMGQIHKQIESRARTATLTSGTVAAPPC